MAVDAAVIAERIIQEILILIRLPVKSLVRCRCVCKSWNALFYDPNFLSQLNRSTVHYLNPKTDTDDDDDDCLILMNNYYKIKTTPPPPPYGLSILSAKKLSETCITNNYAPYPLSISSSDIHLVGSINGLVCIAYKFEGNHQFVLWNPTIRLFKKILVPKLDASPFLYGFGWNSVTNDYKLIAKPYDEGVLSAGVYSCKTDCWSDVDSVSMDSSIFIGWQRHPSVIVNGSPYWYNWMDTNVVKFEITSNEFTYLKAPSGGSAGIYTNLMNLNDCLASIKYNSYSGAAEVYRYDEQHDIWMNVYAFDKYTSHDDIEINCFKYGGEIVFHGKKHLYLYDPKSRKIKSQRRHCHRCGACLAKSRKRKRHGGSHDCGGNVVNGFSYTRSLVALQGMKALHL